MAIPLMAVSSFSVSAGMVSRALVDFVKTSSSLHETKMPEIRKQSIMPYSIRALLRKYVLRINIWVEY